MEIDLGNLLLLLIRRRKTILFITLGFLLAGVILGFILPKRYESKAKVFPPLEAPETGSILAGLSQQLGRVGISMAQISGMPTSIDIFVAILKSNTAAEEVAEECGLKKIYGKKAIEKLNKMAKFIVLPEGVIEIKVKSPSPELSSKIANSYIKALDRFVTTTNMTRGRNTRIFIEGRLKKEKEELMAAEESLKVFEQKYKTVALDEETKRAIEFYANLKAQQVSKEIELATLKTFATLNNPLYLTTERQLREINQRLKELEQGGGGMRGFGVGFGVAFKNLPAMGAEYARRLRDVRIHEEIYGLLIQQYEQAKIMEARDTPSVVVLEWAKPGSLIWPRKKLLILLFGFLGLVIGGISVLIGQFFKNMEKNPDFQKFRKELESIIKRRRGGIRKRD